MSIQRHTARWQGKAWPQDTTSSPECTIGKASANNPPKYNDAWEIRKSDKSQTLIESLPP